LSRTSKQIQQEKIIVIILAGPKINCRRHHSVSQSVRKSGVGGTTIAVAIDPAPLSGKSCQVVVIEWPA